MKERRLNNFFVYTSGCRIPEGVIWAICYTLYNINYIYIHIIKSINHNVPFSEWPLKFQNNLVEYNNLIKQRYFSQFHTLPP